MRGRHRSVLVPSDKKAALIRARLWFCGIASLLLSPALLCKEPAAPTYRENFEKVCDAPEAAGRSLVEARLNRGVDWAFDLPRAAAALGLEIEARTPPEQLRIGSVMIDPGRPVAWHRFTSADSEIWIDVVEHLRVYDSRAVMAQRDQFHSGEFGGRFSSFIALDAGDRSAVAAVVQRDHYLINVGHHLPFAVLPPRDGENTAAQRRAVASAIDAITHGLQAVANVFVASPVSAEVAEDSPSQSERRVSSFVRLWSEVRFNFVFFDERPDLDWDGVLTRNLPRVAAARTDAEYVAILEETMALLGDGHTWVFPTPEAREPRDSPPLRIESIGARPVVTRTLPGAEVTAGAELVSVDGVPVDRLLSETLYPRTFASTPQDRRSRAFRRLLSGAPGSSVKATFEGLDGYRFDAVLKRDAQQHVEAAVWLKPPAFQFRMLEGGIAYVALNSFRDQQVAADFDRHFDEILAARALILDLRRNGGGSSHNGYRIVARLIDEPAQASKWRTRLYRPAHRAWGQAEGWFEEEPRTIRPRGDQPFGGPVVVLIGPRTYSAAEDFLVPLKAMQRAILVGTPTGGSTGQPLVLDLHAARAGILTKWDLFPDGTEFVGIGIQPDVQVEPTREDVAAGRDVVLERGVELARSDLALPR